MLAMVRIALDRMGLARLGRRIGLPPEPYDSGYLAHCALTGLWGDDAPLRPFVVQDNKGGRRVPVYGYMEIPTHRIPSDNAEVLTRELADWARLYSAPDVYQLVDWDGFGVKPLPAAFQEGRCYRFETRACPIVRRKGLPDTDVYTVAARVTRLQDDPTAPRSPLPHVTTVYSSWLADELEPRGARVLSATVKHRQTRSFVRRDHKAQRSSQIVRGPDVTLDGTLQVTDPLAFHKLLSGGYGHHRGFGFGMLLLQQPG